MAEIEPLFLQAGEYTAAEVRTLLSALLGADHWNSADEFSGVTTTGGLKVTATGTPDMNVHVAPGLAFVKGTEATGQGFYVVGNDADLARTIAAADNTNDRHDIVYVAVRDSEYSGSNDDGPIAVATGIPSATPADPDLPENALPLARVVVQANASSITNGDITDLRTAASARSVVVCTSSTRPPNPRRGQVIFESDTGSVLVYYGATTGWRPPWNRPWGLVAFGQVTANSGPITTAQTNVVSADVTPLANRRYRVFAKCRPTTASTGLNVFCTLETVPSGADLDVIGDTLAAGGQTTMRPEYVGGLSTSVTGVRMGLNTSTGTIVNAAGSTFPTFIGVEDLGPSGSAPSD